MRLSQMQLGKFCINGWPALILCPTAGKRHPHHGIGCPRPQATTIVAGVYAHRRVLSLVTAYEVCVCEWLDQRRGPLKTFHLH